VVLKNIYQINEFLIRGYMPCTDPYITIVYYEIKCVN